MRTPLFPVVMVCLGYVLAIAGMIALAQPDPMPDYPLYRLGRYANRGDINWWEGSAYTYIPLTGWTCALPEALPSSPGAWRMRDPHAIAGQNTDCEVNPGASAAIYQNRRTDTVYYYRLAVRESEWDGWSAEANVDSPPATMPGGPANLRIRPLEEP